VIGYPFITQRRGGKKEFLTCMRKELGLSPRGGGSDGLVPSLSKEGRERFCQEVGEGERGGIFQVKGKKNALPCHSGKGESHSGLKKEGGRGKRVGS